MQGVRTWDARLTPLSLSIPLTLEAILPESLAPDPAPATDQPAKPTTEPATNRALDTRPTVSKLLIAVLVASVVAIAGWVAFGVSASNPRDAVSAADKSRATAEDRIETLQSNSASLDRDLDEMTKSRDVYKNASDEVTALEKTVSERELAVTGREEAITAKETRIQATTLTDGTYYTVGVSMETGTYQATSTSGRCYWKITKSGTNYDDIVENDLGGIGVLTVAVSGGQDFQSSSCGDWIKIA